jgi:hypothetical protein
MVSLTPTGTKIFRFRLTLLATRKSRVRNIGSFPLTPVIYAFLPQNCVMNNQPSHPIASFPPK